MASREVEEKLEALTDVCQRLLRYAEMPDGYGFTVGVIDPNGDWYEMLADDDLAFMLEEIGELLEVANAS